MPAINPRATARNDDDAMSLSDDESREPASVFAAAGPGWGNLPSWEVAVGHRLALADRRG